MEQHYHTHRTSVPFWRKVFYIALGAGAMYWMAHGGTDALKEYAGKARDGLGRAVFKAYQEQQKEARP
jgi:hypothetical protein